MSRERKERKKEKGEKYMSACRLYNLKIRAKMQNQAVTAALNY